MTSDVRHARGIRYLMSDRADIADAEQAEGIETEEIDTSMDEPHGWDNVMTQVELGSDLLNSLDQTTYKDCSVI